MASFIAIIGTKDNKIRPNAYVPVFQYLSSSSKPMLFYGGVILFDHDGNSQAVHNKLSSLLEADMDLCVFEISSGTFKILDDRRNERLRSIFEK